MTGRPKPSLRAGAANWRHYDAPFGAKLRMLLRNSWTKARTRANCCGHDGEPGC